MLASIADTVVRSRGWRRRLIAFAAGAFGALALAPISFGPALDRSPWSSRSGCSTGTRSRGAALAPAAPRGGTAPRFRNRMVARLRLVRRRLLVAVGRLSHRSRVHLGACRSACSACRRLLALFFGAGFALARLIYGYQASGTRARAGARPVGPREGARGHLFTGFPVGIRSAWGSAAISSPRRLAALDRPRRAHAR